MKILALNGSPRKGGNTEILINEVLKGAVNFKNETIRLYPKKIEPCMDCRKCKSEPFQCSVNDDMQKLYKKIDDSEIIIFGTPVYYYGPTAKMKLLIDRLRPYIANKKLKNKKGIIVLPAEEGPVACQNTVEIFKKSFQYMAMTLTEVIYGTAYEKGEIKNRKDELKKAYDAGANLLVR